MKQHRSSCSGPPAVYQDFSTCHDWAVKKAIVDLPIKLKGNSKCTTVDLLSLLGAQSKDLGAPFQLLLTRVKLCL